MKLGDASIAVMRDKGQVTIPARVRKAANLQEGDLFDILITAEGILLRPRKLVDATQAWFWTPAWQTDEQEASDDIRSGRTRTYESQEGFLRRFEK
jgi:AbrB family looped-hinge helix DNA binding protein